MRFVITGGAGFIGSRLVLRLARVPGLRVAIVDNLSTGSFAHLAEVLLEAGTVAEESSSDGRSLVVGGRSVVELTEGDIRDLAACERSIEKDDIVVHLAAKTGVIPSITDPIADAEVNVLGTLNVLMAAQRVGARGVVLASSGAPLGDHPPPFHEDLPPRPLSPYGASKLASEAYASAFSGAFGLPTVVMRFSNVYGPHSGHKQSVVIRFLADAAKSGAITIYGDGQQTRDFIFVDDLCEAILRAGDRLTPNRPSCGLFQIGSGIETTVSELARKIQALAGERVVVRYEAARAGEVSRSYADISKARNELGFEASVTLDEGLLRTHAWFVSKYTTRATPTSGCG